MGRKVCITNSGHLNDKQSALGNESLRGGWGGAVGGGQEGRRAGGHGVILEESRQRGCPWSPHPKKRRREAAGGDGGTGGLSGAGS